MIILLIIRFTTVQHGMCRKRDEGSGGTEYLGEVGEGWMEEKGLTSGIISRHIKMQRQMTIHAPTPVLHRRYQINAANLNMEVRVPCSRQR